MSDYDTVILGAGAAGMMCAAHAAAQGARVLIVDHAKAPGEKIRISGGGRCNFTNIYAGPDNFLSANPHFCKSALKRYTQYDFIDLIDAYGIAYHEKTLGQLFCDNSAKDVIAMLLAEMAKVGAELRLQTSVEQVTKTESGFSIKLTNAKEAISARNFVIASGGKSIPKMGATGLGYRFAEQFGLDQTETRAGLVPLTFDEGMTERLKALSGIALPARVTCGDTQFEEALLFTHRGLSGPSILQISSYWRETQSIRVVLAPDIDVYTVLRDRRSTTPKKTLGAVVAELLPNRLAADIVAHAGFNGVLADISDKKLRLLADMINDWQVKPTGTEGYRTAEVTLGGVDTAGLDSKTMAARKVPGLYCIGEVVDVTGWLGGYNFQWAWSSGWAAGVAIAAS
ncbi:MAG: NAD(P)/FAD-dependent oxidoreductase [Alphaproteobacteria bacterium]